MLKNTERASCKDSHTVFLTGSRYGVSTLGKVRSVSGNKVFNRCSGTPEAEVSAVQDVVVMASSVECKAWSCEEKRCWHNNEM